MFTRFEKAEARRARRSGGMVLSVAAHAALVWLAAVATVRGNEPPPPEPPPPLVYLPPRPEPQPLPEVAPGTMSPSPSGAPAAREPRPVRRIEAPAFVPPELPPIATGAPSALDDAIEIGREAIGSGTAAGSPGVGGHPGAGGIWEGPMVEVEARARPGNPAPRYPAVLEQSGVVGRVVARFVVDTSGRVERGSVEVVASDAELFTAAVRRVLAGYRFEPARVSGRPVRQLVELPFVFAARR